MNYWLGVKVLAGIVALLIVGCGNFQTNPSEEIRKKYSAFLETKMDLLLDKHARLVDQVQQGRPKTEQQTSLNKTLDDLTKKGEAVQGQMGELQSAKGANWHALQFGVNQALEELTQAYDNALAQFVG